MVVPVLISMRDLDRELYIDCSLCIQTEELEVCAEFNAVLLSLAFDITWSENTLHIYQSHQVLFPSQTGFPWC